MDPKASKPHVVLLSSPGLGHLIPVLELGKRLVTLFNFEVTIFSVASHTSPAEAQLLRPAMTDPKLCPIIEFPPVDISTLVDPQAALVTKLCVMMRAIKPVFKSAVSMLKFRPAAIIVDLFGTQSLDVAKELGVPNYVFIGCSAWFVALTLYLPTLDKEVVGEFVDQPEPLKIPGCEPVRPEDVMDPMLDRTNQVCSEFVRIGMEIPMADGILVNTWESLQSTTMEAFRDEKHLGSIVNKPVFPIGPLRRPVGPVGSTIRDELIGWLDEQPKASVVYVSFGSGGTLSLEQMTELAWGLELSRQRFIWTIRSPTNTSDGAYLTGGSSGEQAMSSYLPDGFLTRTQNVGKLVPCWAPQMEIISHPSVGLFLSHCGWNSTLESITNGVPMIAWPLYAEQRMNATLLAEELCVAVRPKVVPKKEVVKRDEIEKMVKRVLVEEEGIEIRKRVQQLKESGEKALSEGGSSYNSLFSLANQCKKTWEHQLQPNAPQVPLETARVVS